MVPIEDLMALSGIRGIFAHHGTQCPYKGMGLTPSGGETRGLFVPRISLPRQLRGIWNTC
jgi:hypothetical protein